MLIVPGEDDKTAPPENGRRMQQEFAERITLVNLKDAGHLMGLEKNPGNRSGYRLVSRQTPHNGDELTRKNTLNKSAVN